MRQLRRKAFQEWLESKDADEIVGQCRRTELCPIAMHLRALGDKRTMVSDIDRSDFIERRLLSNWAKKFVKRVDAIDSAEISAERALKILESIDQ